MKTVEYWFFTAGIFFVCIFRSAESGCAEILDTIPIEKQNGIEAAYTKIGSEPPPGFKHQVNQIWVTSIGIGYSPHPSINPVSYEFFVGSMWEIIQHGAISTVGTIAADFDSSITGTLTAGFDLYPFPYGTTPFAGIELGFGYVQTSDGSGFGAAGALKAGVFAVRISDLLLTFSLRVSGILKRINESYPTVVAIHAGILF
jgi:hypothetical protein